LVEDGLWLTGSNPVRLTTKINDLAEIYKSENPIGETLGKHFTVLSVD